MTEEERPAAEDRGWSVSLARLRADVYQAACILAADNWTWFYEMRPLNELRDEFEQDTLDHAFITLAIRARTAIDQVSPRPTTALETCGRLLKDDMGCKDAGPLALREACNKIIHAHSRTLEEEEDGQHRTSVIHLEGSRLGQPWRVELNGIRFLELVLDLTRELGGGEQERP